MEGSIKRVTAVINGALPDRAPMFDLLRNDAVIEHFTGESLTLDNAHKVVPSAYGPAIDATRSMRLPGRKETITLEDGREQKNYRWTSWTAHKEYRDTEHYVAEKRAILDTADPTSWNSEHQARLETHLADLTKQDEERGDFLFFPGIGSPGLTSLYAEVGLEQFSYLLVDSPDIIDELLELRTIETVTRVNHYPADHGRLVYFMADDVAFKSGPVFSPVWMREHYFPRLARISDALHRKDIKLLFHSDGDLNPILDDLVEAGIDGLNPIEVLANMDVSEIHRRYPHLFMAGGIDVSQLLPLGSPGEVRDAVIRALDAAEGRLMVGSTTELHNDVPLENFLAMRDAVLDNSY